MASTAPILETWILAEFPDPHSLVEATAKMREKGYVNMDTYSPYPLHGSSEALGLKPSKVPFIAAGGAITGLITAFSFQTYMNAIDYPLNVGGRPLLSLPAWFPIMFELTVLLTAFGIVFGLLALSRLPQPYHPAFEHPDFLSASTHGYWLSVADDAQPTDKTVSDLTALGAKQTTVIRGERE